MKKPFIKYSYDKIKSGYEKFSTATSMHGFAELYLAKSLFFTIVWVIVIIMSLGMTAYQIHGSIQQFVTQPDAVSIEPLTPGYPVLYPNLQLCHQHWVYWLDFEAAFKLNFTKYGVLYGVSYLSEVFSQTYFDVKEAKRNFFLSMKSNNFSTISKFFKAVSRRTPENGEVNQDQEAKNTYFKPGEVKLLYALKMPVFCYSIPGDVIWEQIRSNVTNNGVEDEERLKDYSERKRLQFYVSDRDMNYSNVTPLEYNCYVADYFYSYSDRYVEREKFRNYNKTLPRLPMLLYVNEYSPFEVKLHWDYSEINIKVKASVYERKNAENEMCSFGERLNLANNSCEIMCETKYNLDNCVCPNLEWAARVGEDYPHQLCSYKIYFLKQPSNCLEILEKKSQIPNFIEAVAPTVLTKPKKAENFCPSNLYDERKCCKNATGATVFRDCMQSCQRKGCEIWTYEISVGTINSDAEEFDEISGKYIVKINIMYPTEEDILYARKIGIQSWDNFIGNVGGLLGVWTGASIISIFQLFYLCCCTECGCCPTRELTVFQTALKRKNNLIGINFNAACENNQDK